MMIGLIVFMGVGKGGDDYVLDNIGEIEEWKKEGE